MNREYTKFNPPRAEYIPPITQSDHFSEFPPELIPPDHVDVPVDSIEKDYQELIRETETPPPTPPELEPGTAACRMFRERAHYVAPAYQVDLYQREFTTRVLVGYIITLCPVTFGISILCFTEVLESLEHHTGPTFFCFGFGILAFYAYTYFVGLCRNPPFLYIMLVIRSIIFLFITLSISVLMQIGFINLVISYQSGNVTDEIKIKHDNSESSSFQWASSEDFHHTQPYTILLCLVITYVNIVCIIVLLIKYELSVSDYRIPFLVYSVTFAVTPVLETLVLNGAFQHEPLSYDLFQVALGCFLACGISLRIPAFFDRLYSGKVCPLREGELLYALLHYGL